MVTATFTDGSALICVIPSRTKNGVYLVKVESYGDKQLVVTHSCPSHRFKNTCSHVNEAVKCYRKWRWWEHRKRVQTKKGYITLQPEWEQIPVPGSMQETVFQVLTGDSYAS